MRHTSACAVVEEEDGEVEDSDYGKDVEEVLLACVAEEPLGDDHNVLV